MIKDLRKINEQLKELASIVNSFKSEAVQLRFLELVFEQSAKQVETIVVEPVKEEKAPVFEEVKPAGKKRGRKKKVADAAPVSEVIEQTEAEVTKVRKGKPGRKPGKKTTVVVEQKPKERRRRTAERPGPSVILKMLVDNDYFADFRTIGDIVQYCSDNYKYKYKSTDLSGTLIRFVKEGVLKRELNTEKNLFQYSKIV